MPTEIAIAVAETTISDGERASDLTCCPDPQAAQDAVSRASAARFNKNRLAGILPKLRERYAAALQTARRAKWQGFHDLVAAEREPLAQELADFLRRVETEQADLRKRIREFNAECGYVNNLGRQVDEWCSIEALDLPNLMESIPSRPGGMSVNGSFASTYAMSMVPPSDAGGIGPNWTDPEVRAQRREAVERDQQRIGQFYADQTKHQEERG